MLDNVVDIAVVRRGSRRMIKKHASIFAEEADASGDQGLMVHYAYGCCSGLVFARASAPAQDPKPQTVVIAAAYQEFSRNAAAFTSHKRKRYARETGEVPLAAYSPLS